MGDQLVYQLSLFCDYVTVPSVNWTSSNLKDILGTVEVDTPCDGLQGRAEHMFEDLMAKADKGHYTLVLCVNSRLVIATNVHLSYCSVTSQGLQSCDWGVRPPTVEPSGGSYWSTDKFGPIDQ